MWKKFTIIAISAVALNACAGPAVTGFEASRQEGLNNTALSRGACDSVGQLLPGASMPVGLTLGPSSSVTLEASAAPAH